MTLSSKTIHMLNNRYVIILTLFLFTFLADAQSDYNSDMEKTLHKMQLEYIQPVEQTPTFLKKGEIKYFKYDFGMEIDDGDMLILVQTRRDDGNYIPQVAVPGLVSTLATNKQEFDIRMMGTGDRYLKETNSDWAMESLFIPKQNMTKYNIAYFKTMFKAGIGAVNILYLSKEEIEVFPVVRFSTDQ